MKHIIHGRRAEQKVCEDLERKNFQLLFMNLKTPYAEVDLVMKRSGSCFLIEVKTLTDLVFMENRVSYKQRSRLLRACSFLQKKWNIDPRLVYAFYRVQTQEIMYFDALSGEPFAYVYK